VRGDCRKGGGTPQLRGSEALPGAQAKAMALVGIVEGSQTAEGRVLLREATNTFGLWLRGTPMKTFPTGRLIEWCAPSARGDGLVCIRPEHASIRCLCYEKNPHVKE